MAKLEFENLKQSLILKYKEYFPQSYIHVVLWDYEKPSISIYLALGKDENEFKSGDFQNDPGYNHIVITGFDKKKEFSSLELNKSAPFSLRTVAPITFSAYYHSIPIDFKATSGNQAKILKSFEENIIKLFINVFAYSNKLKAKYDIINKLSKSKLGAMQLSDE